ncbi:MAG: S16 family serine protease, partial [Nanoarchaeota archaeon]
MKKWWIVILLAFMLSISLASAQKTYHLKLLAVQENGDGTSAGSGADLFLELKEGTGRVFLDTFPVTKMDTQISTRFAKEIACHEFKLPCHRYDFIYTIKADSNIIGGPSAGAAIAALTTIAALDLDYDQGIAITGTINSGGIVGPVGGVKQKLEAASRLSLKKVLVAKGTASIPEEEVNSTSQINSSDFNESINFNLTKYAAENLSLDMVEVSSLDEVLFDLTGKQLNHKEVTIAENEDYTQIMNNLRDRLCQRVEKIRSEFRKEGLYINESIIQRVGEQQNKSENATRQGDHYSAASYCFTANILLRSEYYGAKKPSLSIVWDRFILLEKDVQNLEKDLKKEPIETITDLQVFLVVKERLDDVREQISEFKANQGEKADHYYASLSYAEERFYSAQAWMEFFSMGGKKLVLDKAHMQQSCLQKTSEAEERYNYLRLYIGEGNIMDIGKKIDGAKSASGKGEYELCLSKSIEAKGDSNAVLSSMGLRRDILPEILDSKNAAVKRVIAENSAEGKFPILGYSYYKYANSLQEQEPFTALVYYEYALE